MVGWYGQAAESNAAPASSTNADNKVSQKVFYIGVWKAQKPTHELARAKDLSSINYFQRNIAGETMDFVVKTTAESPLSLEGKKQQIDLQGKYAVHSRGSDSGGLVGIVVTEAGYSAVAAHSLLNKVLTQFLIDHPRPTWANSNPTFNEPNWMKLMKQYDEPEKADDILTIQKELDQTKAVLHKTIESVLARGEKLDDLVAKSDQLSYQSRGFYAASKKQNSCCILM